MKISVTKIWIALALFAALVFLAIVVTISQEAKIQELNGKVADLTKLYTAEKQTHGTALEQVGAATAEKDALNEKIASLTEKNASLKKETESLCAENEQLKKSLTFVEAPNKFTIAVDQRLDPEIVALIRQYFGAMTSGNLDAYRATLGSPDSDHLDWCFETQKNKNMQVVSITAHEQISADILQRGGFFVAVTFSEAGQLNWYHLGVTKKDGKWVIYNND